VTTAARAVEARGRLVYATDGRLLEAPFDAAADALGPATQVMTGVFSEDGVPDFAASDAGLVVSVPASIADLQEPSRLVWADRSGDEWPACPTHGDVRSAALSPDGEQIAVQLAMEIWICAPDRTRVQKVAFTGPSNLPVWTPDGAAVTFRGVPPGSYVPGLFEARAESPDTIATVIASRPRTPAMRAGQEYERLPDYVPLDGGQGARTLPMLAYRRVSLERSPDGAWLAYADLATLQILVQRYPDLAPPIALSGAFGASLRWSPDSRRLYYVSKDNHVMSVDVPVSPTATTSRPVERLAGPYAAIAGVSPDDQRLLLIRRRQPTDTPHLAAVLNAFR
jgi:hypothetical protein